MFIKHLTLSQSCSYLEVHATLEMVHLCVMRDCKSLYCCHKHSLPGALSAPAAIHLQYVNTYTNTPRGTTATDHVYGQELVWLCFYLRGKILRFCQNLTKVGNAYVFFCFFFRTALAIKQSDCCYDIFSLWFSVCLARFVANVKYPIFLFQCNQTVVTTVGNWILLL